MADHQCSPQPLSDSLPSSEIGLHFRGAMPTWLGTDFQLLCSRVWSCDREDVGPFPWLDGNRPTPHLDHAEHKECASRTASLSPVSRSPERERNGSSSEHGIAGCLGCSSPALSCPGACDVGSNPTHASCTARGPHACSMKKYSFIFMPTLCIKILKGPEPCPSPAGQTPGRV